MIAVSWRHAFAGGIELADRSRCEQPIRLDLAIEAVSLLALLRRPRLFVDGTCAIDDVLPEVDVRGTIDVVRERDAAFRVTYVRYSLRFDRNDAGVVRAEGSQTFGPKQLYASVSVIHLALVGARGETIGRGRLRPDVRGGLKSAARTLRLRRLP